MDHVIRKTVIRTEVGQRVEPEHRKREDKGSSGPS